MTENAKTYLIRWVFDLPLKECQLLAFRWLYHYALDTKSIRELTLDQNEMCAFAVGAMLERIGTE